MIYRTVYDVQKSIFGLKVYFIYFIEVFELVVVEIH